MATAADSSANHHSPRPEFSCEAGVSKRTTPWAKVVRGDSESISANHQSPPPLPSSPMSTSILEQNPSSNCSPSKAVAAARSSPSPPPPADVSSAAEIPNGHNSNAARPNKPAWNKPSKDVLEVGPVMGAVAWPPLSESTKTSPKLSPDSSSKTVTDVSVPVSQGPVITPSTNSKKYPSNLANTNSASNHALPARQRPTKRAMPEPSPRDPSFRGSSWDTRPIGFAPQTHQVNDHRNFSRRGNFGSHPRGDGPYHNNYGNKRDHQDRGNFMNPRDVQIHQQQRPPPRGLVRPVPPSSSAFSPQPARPFASPIGFPEFVYIPTLPLEPIRGMPFISHAPHPAMFIPVAESSMPPLPSLIVNQIDYYFSDTNLIRDEFLRSNMDAQGWVPISLIANFPRVKNLTTNVQLILDSLRASSNVEVLDDKVRRCNDWTKWIPTTGRLAPESGPSPPDVQSSYMLSTSFQKMAVGDGSPSQSSMGGNPDANSMAIPENCSTESTGVLSQLPNGEVTQNNS
ncbi:hypothetical protein M0R45_012336 [Rubus argutus]|uniref:HTH La-type RNA-binding domain-containing protein n=1 Tax=Rubus argutus TaxID=59490 RepID=A0AAW1YDU1_RUBAR